MITHLLDYELKTVKGSKITQTPHNHACLSYGNHLSDPNVIVKLPVKNNPINFQIPNFQIVNFQIANFQILKFQISISNFKFPFSISILSFRLEFEVEV